MNTALPDKVPFWLDPKKRAIMYQIGVLGAIGASKGVANAAPEGCRHGGYSADRQCDNITIAESGRIRPSGSVLRFYGLEHG